MYTQYSPKMIIAATGAAVAAIGLSVFAGNYLNKFSTDLTPTDSHKSDIVYTATRDSEDLEKPYQNDKAHDLDKMLKDHENKPTDNRPKAHDLDEMLKDHENKPTDNRPIDEMLKSKDQNDKPENRQAFDDMKPKDQNKPENRPQAYDIDNMKPKVDENNNNLDSNNPEPAAPVRVPIQAVAPIPAPVQAVAPIAPVQRGGTRRKRSSRKTKKHVNKCHYCKREQEDLGLPVH
jgi:hypothetical protein